MSFRQWKNTWLNLLKTTIKETENELGCRTWKSRIEK